MSGNFTHQQYDPIAYTEKLDRSTKAANYYLDPNYAINCNKCFSPHGAFREGQVENIAKQIDVDSILRGIHKINSKANCFQQPYPLPQIMPSETNRNIDCASELDSEYTRYTHPSYDIKGLTVKDMRFDYPIYDPQCHIFEDFQVNTRLQAKDNHKAIWREPMDQTKCLPQSYARK